MQTLHAMTQIYDWSVTANADGLTVLTGKVMNHPVHADYSKVTTSPVLEVKTVGKAIVVVTRNREYKMGYINSEFADRHPNGRNMFIAKYTQVPA